MYHLKMKRCLRKSSVYTPDCKTIDDLCSYLNVNAQRTVKNLAFNLDGELLLVLIPGDRELNETKLYKYLGVQDFNIEMADHEFIQKHTKGEACFIGPIGSKI